MMGNPTKRVLSLWVLFGLLFWMVQGCGGASSEGSASTLPPLDPRAVSEFNAGNRLLGRGRISRARSRLERAVEIDPNLWEAHYNLGVIDRRSGQTSRAIQYFETARRIQPSASEPTLALAELKYAAGELGEAASLLRDVVEADPDNLPARVALATVLREDGSLSDALTAAREVLIRDSSNISALLEVGRIYRVRDEPDVSELVFKKALAILADAEEPRRVAEIKNELGLLALARGDTQAAFVAFQEAIAADAAFTPAHMNQGSVLLKSGDYAGAVAEYRAVLEVDGDDLDARCALGVALRGSGELLAARRTYRAILDEDASYAPALFNMGVLLAEFADQRPQARRFFQRFLDAAAGDDPKRARAEQYLREIPGPQGAGG